jgi:hypothetical protein
VSITKFYSSENTLKHRCSGCKGLHQIAATVREGIIFVVKSENFKALEKGKSK